MQLSELIQELVEYQSKHGDLPVFVHDMNDDLTPPVTRHKVAIMRKREPGMYSWGPTPERIEIS